TNLSFPIVPTVISAFTKREDVIIPLAPLCNNPVVSACIRNVPAELKLIYNVPFVENCNEPKLCDNPVSEVPICNDGISKDPLGNNKFPDKVPPVNARSKLACPIIFPVNIPIKLF